MRIAFKFHYIHDNGLFSRLLERVKEKSSLELTLYQEKFDHVIEASGDQSELESLAELVSSLIPQSLFLSEHSIEEVKEPYASHGLKKDESEFNVPYCPECQEKIIETLDPFEPCSVCGYSEKKLSIEEFKSFASTDAQAAKMLFEDLAEKLINEQKLTLMTYKGIRNFSLLGTQESAESGILICDPSEISSFFVITQDELNTLIMVEKPSMKLKPKLKFRAENDLSKPLYPIFLADDKVTLALSLALSKKGVFAVYCDQTPSLQTASALQQHVIINTGGDMLPWRYPLDLGKAASCTFDGYTAYGDENGLLLDTRFEPSASCVQFTSKEESSSVKNGLSFEPSHAALRSIVLEHDLVGKSLCGIYLSRRNDSQICSFSSKIGYTALANFSYEVPSEPILMLESIAQMDEEGTRLVANYKREYPKLFECIEQASFDSDNKASMLTRLWAMAALFIGLSEGGDIQTASEQLESTALEFNGKSGPRIDYKVMKDESGYIVDPRLAIRSAMSFKLAGVDEYLLSFGFIDSLADFIAQQAEMADANIAIEGVTLSGSLFENRQLLMRTYNALSPNYKIYRNERLALDGANIAVGAITLGSE